jgi:ParB-like chromosome segregation protein Spo0J
MQISNKYQVMPPLTPEEYHGLKGDIAENGVLVSVVQDEEGTIIDGHYRVQAYQQLEAEGRIAGGYPVDVRSGLTEDEKRDLAWRLNMQRRHLNQAQKQKAIIAKLKESPQWSDNRIAQLLGVDHKTVRVQRVILEGSRGIPKVEKVIGTDGKEYPRELEKKVKDKLQDAGLKPRFAAAYAQGLVQGAVTRERDEGPLWGENAAPTPSPQVQPTQAPDRTDWTDEEQALFERVMDGETVVANMHNDGHPSLVEWAKAVGRFVLIDRRNKWGNPFELGEDGDRDTVVDNFEQHYLPYKPSLWNKREDLRGGKVLGCWCAPKRCHGDVLKSWAEA